MSTEPDDALRIHYRSGVVERMTSLLNIWWSPKFQHDIVSERNRALSTIEVRILWTLGSRGPSRPSELAEALDASAPNLSKALAKLDAAGLVTRERNASDQRSHTIHLSAVGRLAAQELYDVGDEMVGEIFAEWEERDIQQLTVLLARFVDDSERFARRIDRDR